MKSGPIQLILQLVSFQHRRDYCTIGETTFERIRRHEDMPVGVVGSDT